MTPSNEKLFIEWLDKHISKCPEYNSLIKGVFEICKEKFIILNTIESPEEELISFIHKEIGFALARENGERAKAFLDVLEKIKPITPTTLS